MAKLTYVCSADHRYHQQVVEFTFAFCVVSRYVEQVVLHNYMYIICVFGGVKDWYYIIYIYIYIYIFLSPLIISSYLCVLYV